MKKLSNSLLLMLLASAFLMFACGGDDERPKNQFSAEGDSYKLSKSYSVLADQIEDEDGNDIYIHYVYLVGDGLDVDVEGGNIELSGEGNILAFGLISSDDDLAEGTYEFGGGAEAGVVGESLIYSDYNPNSGEYDRIFGAIEGTIKVSKSGGKTTFKINVTEFATLDEEGDEVEGEGSLKGYFNGKVTVIEFEEEPARKSKNFNNPFTKGFNF